MFRLTFVLLLGIVVTRAASTNDLFTNRILLSGESLTVSANFTDAGVEAGEPHGLGASLWWEWTAPASRNYALEFIAPTSIAPAATVFSGSWPNLTLESAPAPSFARIGTSVALNGYSKVALRAQAGKTYYIAAASFTNHTIGTVALRIKPGPANDDFANAASVAGVFTAPVANLHGATLEPAESLLSTNSAGASLWWRWRPEKAGRFAIVAQQDDGLGLNLAIYRENRELVASAASDSFGVARLFRDFEDEVYYLTVQDTWKQFGTVRLSAIASSENDNFERPRLLEGTNATSEVLFAAATLQAGEPEAGSFTGSAWFAWQAPFDGGVAVEAVSGGMYSVVAVYQGTAVTNLVRLSAPPLGNRVSFRATAGTRYFVALYGSSNDNATAILRIRPGPANDDFASAQIVKGVGDGLFGALHGGTIEAGEPRAEAFSSVWYRWTPLEAGNYSIDARSSQALLRLGVFRGDNLTNLSLVNEARNGNGTESARLTLAAGTEPLYLRVASEDGSLWPFNLTIRSGPVHDRFADALPLVDLTASGTTRGALAQPEESQFGAGDRPSVWHRWTPPRSGGYEMRVSGGAAGNVVWLLRGSGLSELQPVLRVETESPAAQSAAVRVNGGEDYYLLVGGNTLGGDFYSVTFTPAAANDDFAGRILLTGATPDASASLVGATREPGEPPHAGARTMWWEWVSPGTSGLALRAGSMEQTVRIAVYRGTALGNLTAVPTRTVYLSHVIEENFRAVEGERYFIALAEQGSLMREVTLFSQLAAPNDAFSGAVTITDFDQVHTAPATGATTEPGERPARAGGATVWYRWTAPRDGTFAAIGDNGAPITVFKGTALSNLVELAANSPRSPIAIATFRAAAGDSIYFWLDGGGVLDHRIHLLPAAPNDDFFEAAPIATLGAPVTVPIFYATAEAGEPHHFPDRSPKSLWWKFLAPASAGYRIRVPAVDRSAYLAVYTGDFVTRLAPVAARAGENDLSLTFRGTAGVEYKIAFGQDFEGYGPYQMTLDRSSAHDDFAAAVPLTLGALVTNEVIAATLQPGEITWTDPSKATVWYGWTAATNGNYLVAAGPEAWKPHLAVFRGTNLADLVPVAVATNWLAPARAVVFAGEAGVTYRIAVAIDPLDLDLPLVVQVSAGHPNDSFDAPAELNGRFVAWTNTTLGAMSEPGESNGPLASVWAKWIAPATELYRGVASNVNVQVFTGTNVAGLKLAGMTEFQAQAGTEYRLRIDTATNGMRDFVFRLGPLPTNDTRGTAIELEGTNALGSGWTWNSLRDTNEGRESIWWSWVAPADGRLSVNGTQPSVFFTAFHARSNSFQTLVSRMNVPITNPPPSFVVTGGDRYLLEISTLVPSTNVVFALQFEPATALSAEWAAALGDYLIGGSEGWRFRPEENLLAAGPLNAGHDAWIETEYLGPGTLRFWWRRAARSNLFYVLETNDGRSFFAPSSTNWTQQVVPLSRATNLVRWTAATLSFRGNPETAYLSNVVFTPTPAKTVSLRARRNTPEQLQVEFLVEAQRNYTLEKSTNLLEWTAVTNFFPTAPMIRMVRVTIDSNAPPAFYRTLTD